jgi:hypothetical protein
VNQAHDNDWAEQLVQKALVSKKLVSAEMIVPGVWDFYFGETHVNVGSPWRIVAQHIQLGSCDHDQKFGLPEPVDAGRKALEMLRDRRIESVAIAPGSSDLRVCFQDEIVLEIFNHSSGYEGWNVSNSEGQVIALGGGELAIWGKTS